MLVKKTDTENNGVYNYPFQIKTRMGKFINYNELNKNDRGSL